MTNEGVGWKTGQSLPTAAVVSKAKKVKISVTTHLLTMQKQLQVQTFLSETADYITIYSSNYNHSSSILAQETPSLVIFLAENTGQAEKQDDRN